MGLWHGRRGFILFIKAKTLKRNNHGKGNFSTGQTTLLRSMSDVQRSCQMVMPSRDLLKSAQRQLQLTPREALRVQAVARTLADLDGSAVIAGKHLGEAIRYLSGFIRGEEYQYTPASE